MTVAVTMTGNVTGPDAPVVSERPENVPEKFWNAESKTVNTEALLASYTALEKKQSTTKVEAPATEQAAPAAEAPKPEGTEEQQQQAPAEEQAREVAANAGIDFEAWSTKFAEQGSYTDADYAELEKSGIPRTMVDAYIAGQQALADAERAKFLAPIGGEDGFNAMAAWAGENLPAADLAAYNAVIDAGDPAAMKMAMENLHTKFKAASTQEPALLTGGAPQTQDVYLSLEQMKADMRKPEYKKDPAFRAKVEAKLARSNV